MYQDSVIPPWLPSLTLRTIEEQIHVNLSYPDPDPPAKPSLETNTTQPTDGDSIRLTCVSTSPGITSYWFQSANIDVQTVSDNFHDISPARIGVDDVSYTCTASIGTFDSEPSDDLVISRK